MPAGRHRDHPGKLLVEGESDKSVIPYLLEANGVAWPRPPNHPVDIESYGGVDKVLEPGVIEAEIRVSGLEALGVVVDANGDAASRWNDVRTWCGGEFADLPEQIPAAGLDIVHSGGPRFGVWIMPVATKCVAEAKSHRAPFRDVHERKAELHTWLAWQDPPGLRLHEAVEHAVLDPAGAESQPFVNWFKNLFRL